MSLQRPCSLVLYTTEWARPRVARGESLDPAFKRSDWLVIDIFDANLSANLKTHSHARAAGRETFLQSWSPLSVRRVHCTVGLLLPTTVHCVCCGTTARSWASRGDLIEGYKCGVPAIFRRSLSSLVCAPRGGALQSHAADWSDHVLLEQQHLLSPGQLRHNSLAKLAVRSSALLSSTNRRRTRRREGGHHRTELR